MKKNILITGSNGAIGCATAVRFLDAGCGVALNYHLKRDRIDGLLARYPSDAKAYSADVSVKDDVEKLVAKVLEDFGRIDILVNNAGVVRDRTFAKMSDDEWNSVIAINLHGTYYMTKAVLKHMLERNSGSVVNISSIIGINGGYGQANYSASKAAVIGLTKSLAKEVAKRGITVNAIAPGYVDTDMTKTIPAEIKTNLVDGIPLGRMGTPEEIADVVYSISGMTYVTGSVVHANGGLA
jgi:NAD(P)-dependent dehydrogenase (short-subunit alcohol dehydrogenase family)